MPGCHKHSTHRRIQVAFGLALAGLCYLELSTQEYEPIAPSSVVLARPQTPANAVEQLIRDDPLAALIEFRAQHLQDVKDYTCTLVKQELLSSGMSAEQEIDVLFRQEPYSVVFHWVRNAQLANRVIYVKGKWVDEDADKAEEREQALCQPGSLGAVFLKSLKQPIHGTMARQTARRSLDEFGFKRTLDLLIKYCEMAKAQGELALEYRGEAQFEGRPVWVLQRHLPYTGEGGKYPDRTADIYVDKEFRVPVAVYCYSDTEKKPANLLGKYEYRKIHLNAGLGEPEFDPDTYGM
jgi:hypothetical protein